METAIEVKLTCERCRFWKDAGGALQRYCACPDSRNEGIHTGAGETCVYYKPAAWVEQKGS